jgi:flagellar hook-associated protein 2
MSTSPAVNSSSGSPLSITGLASGLDTTSIISALLGAEREPITRLTNEQTKLQAQQEQIQSIQSSLQQLVFAASEFALPSLYESSQQVTSSEPTRVSATTSSGSAVGGHEVEVKQLANSAQRTFSFTSPTAEDTLTIDGSEYKVKAGETAKELAAAINSDAKGTAYAAVLESGTIVLSDRATGNTGAEFLKVSDPGGVLVEKAGTAREGKDAEFTVDGVAGTSASNTVTNAIAGVTLSLNGLTPNGPVTINVQAPGPSASAIESQVQAFVKSYNTTIEAIQKQLSTKPVSKPSSASEYGTGTLYGDSELSGLLGRMREIMYEPVAGLPDEMASPANIGVSTGAPTGGASSTASLEGKLTLNAARLTEAIKSNPGGVQEMLEGWASSMQGAINAVAEVGGTLEERSQGDGAQIRELTTQIATMNELLAVREKALQQTYAELETVISQNSSQSTWLTSEAAKMAANSI